MRACTFTITRSLYYITLGEQDYGAKASILKFVRT